MKNLFTQSARSVVKALRDGDLAPAEAVEAIAARVHAVNPRVNAVCIDLTERAMKTARGLSGGELAALRRTPLAGLPLLIKDYNDVSGVPTTKGCVGLKDAVAAESDLVVQRLERSGAIVYGKSNVPEFAGAHTYNELFGVTRNPWNLALSAGGSSGGAGAALAAGMAWLATGNDLGGSVRTPASFCSVVGLRPSPGRIARGPLAMPFNTLWVEGPMARDVADTGLMFDAQVGYDPRDPISLPAEGESYQAAAGAPARPPRIAYSRDLGVCEVEDEVAAVCRAAAERLSADGVQVAEAEPQLQGAPETFHVLRAHLFAGLMEPLMETHRPFIKDDIIWNVEKGLDQRAVDISRAERRRAELIRVFDDFLEQHDFLVLPAAQVLPFPVEQRHPTSINGQALATYIDWIAINYCLTLTGCPVLSLPCGFSRDGIPVGVQIVGKRRGEAALLRFGAYCEALWGIGGAVPIDPRP